MRSHVYPTAESEWFLSLHTNWALEGEQRLELCCNGMSAGGTVDLLDPLRVLIDDVVHIRRKAL